MATWEWMSTVVLLGLRSRPALPCVRAAVRSYLFQWVIVVLLQAVGWAKARSRARPFHTKVAAPCPRLRPCRCGEDAWAWRAQLSVSTAHRLVCAPLPTLRRPMSKHPQMLRHDGVVELEVAGGAAKHHAAGVDDDDIVGE